MTETVFRRERHFLVAETQLQAFTGYRKTRTPWRSLENMDSDGRVTVFAEPMDGDGVALSAAQDAVLGFLFAHQDELSLTIAQALLERYPALRENYLEFTEDDEADEILPLITTAEELKRLIGLANVHLLDGSHIGFEFGCTWDEEGGLGVMTQNGRIIAIGQSPTAFEQP